VVVVNFSHCKTVSEGRWLSECCNYSALQIQAIHFLMINIHQETQKNILLVCYLLFRLS